MSAIGPLASSIDAMSLTSARTLLGIFARAILGDAQRQARRVGAVELHPHQQDALARVRALLARDGGALLADEVGLGKTWVALALMQEARAPVVVAPASLRPMWTQALARAGLAAPLVSIESLSRGRMPATRADLLVVDEAHQVRTPHTRRYDAVAALGCGARTLLLTATPIHNRTRDLAALLALFLGDAAHAMPDDVLARHVVRHTRDDAMMASGALPRVDPPRWLSLAVADGERERDVLDAIVALPPPVPPADGGDAGALLTWTLVRQWASSRAALRGALRRRLAAAGAMLDALDAGRTPTKGELAAWSEAEGVVQLAFAELLSPPPAVAPRGELRDAVSRHAQALRALLDRIATTSDPDRARADALRALRREHDGERIVAFSERAETVAAYYAILRVDGRVAALTAQGGRIAGGACTRADVLRRFAPRAQGVAPPPGAERIDLLLTTDLLSEGVNLQDASVVVHLDLPWSPARLEQRVGRVRRLGAARERVAIHLMPPPVAAERLLGVEQRLRAKLAVAARSVGVAGTVLPSLVALPTAIEKVAVSDSRGDAEEATRVRSLLTVWLDEPDVCELHAPPLIGVCAADHCGALALVYEHGESRLVASLQDGVITDRGAVVRRVLEGLRPDAPARGDSFDARLAVSRVLRAVESWLARRSGISIAGLIAPRTARSRKRVLDRIAAVGACAPRHRRAPLSPLLAEARRAASVPLGVGAERVLEALAASVLDDEAWLRAVATFGRLHSPGGALARQGPESPRVLALLVQLPP